MQTNGLAQKKSEVNHFQNSKKMNLTIGSRFRSMVLVWVQVCVSGVKFLCRVRISGRFGRVDPEFRLSTEKRTLPFVLLTRDSGEISKF